MINTINVLSISIELYVFAIKKLNKLSHNSGFAKKRVQWLIEHSTSHHHLCYVDNFELRNSLLRKAANRYASL